MKLLRHCELCNAEAAVYCTSDAAFLCWTCDLKVHDDNFLVARHVRRPICSNCKIFTGDSISGVAFKPFSAACPSCPAISDDSDSLSSSTSSSACISSTTTNPEKRDCNFRGFDSNSSSLINSQKSRRKLAKPEMDYLKAEAIFVNWCGKLGVVRIDVAVRMACSALRVLCLERRWKVVLPFRVSLAASMWLGLRLAGDKSALTWQTLKRLEEVSGVPEKLILAAEMKLEKALRRGREQQQRRRLELEEGWAEC